MVGVAEFCLSVHIGWRPQRATTSGTMGKPGLTGILYTVLGDEEV
jgi:hypothetical protein